MAPTSVVYEFVSVAVPDDAIGLRLSDHIVRMVQDTVLQQLLLWSGVGLALIALLTGFMGWWLVGRALAPVAAMTDTARRIASLLLLARSDLGLDEDETEESDLRDAAHQAVGKLLPQAEEKKVSLELAADGPMPVIGDPVLLRHLMTNLVDNAVRYNTVWACPSSHRSPGARCPRHRPPETGRRTHGLGHVHRHLNTATQLTGLGAFAPAGEDGAAYCGSLDRACGNGMSTLSESI